MRPDAKVKRRADAELACWGEEAGRSESKRRGRTYLLPFPSELREPTDPAVGTTLLHVINDGLLPIELFYAWPPGASIAASLPARPHWDLLFGLDFRLCFA
jgi:hypothetical protein